MPKITLALSEKNDEWIRSQMRKHGDLSRIVNEALDKARKGETK